MIHGHGNAGTQFWLALILTITIKSSIVIANDTTNDGGLTMKMNWRWLLLWAIWWQGSWLV